MRASRTPRGSRRCWRKSRTDARAAGCERPRLTRCSSSTSRRGSRRTTSWRRPPRTRHAQGRPWWHPRSLRHRSPRAAVGRGTRLLQFVPAEPKIYDATIRFGTETDTDDVDGRRRSSSAAPDPAAVLAALPALTGIAPAGATGILSQARRRRSAPTRWRARRTPRCSPRSRAGRRVAGRWTRGGADGAARCAIRCASLRRRHLHPCARPRPGTCGRIAAHLTRCAACAVGRSTWRMR